MLKREILKNLSDSVKLGLIMLIMSSACTRSLSISLCTSQWKVMDKNNNTMQKYSTLSAYHPQMPSKKDEDPWT